MLRADGGRPTPPQAARPASRFIADSASNGSASPNGHPAWSVGKPALPFEFRPFPSTHQSPYLCCLKSSLRNSKGSNEDIACDHRRASCIRQYRFMRAVEGDSLLLSPHAGDGVAGSEIAVRTGQGPLEATGLEQSRRLRFHPHEAGTVSRPTR